MIRETGAGFRNCTSSRSTVASGGISIITGRGRPVLICLNASVTAPGIALGVSACRRHSFWPCFIYSIRLGQVPQHGPLSSQQGSLKTTRERQAF